jgi:hypothetical protein
VQIHDFNPGFGPAVDPNGSNGLGDRVLWTVPIDDSDVTVHFGAGKAELSARNLNMFDFLNKRNAFGSNWDNPPYGATVSFDVVWDVPVTRRLDFQDGTDVDQFSGSYVENQATVTWSASNTNGFTFTANPGNFSTSSDPFAELAHEQNGTFFSPDAPKDQVVAHNLTLALPVLPSPKPKVAAPLVSAALPATRQAPDSIVIVAQNNNLAITTADPGGSDSPTESGGLGGELLFP